MYTGTNHAILICDTDAFATEVWHERYVGSRSDAVAAIAQCMPPRLGYILTSWQDVSFEQDGLRDGEHIREWMHDVFADRLGAMNAPCLLAAGSLAKRTDSCVSWIDARLKLAWQFTAPLG